MKSNEKIVYGFLECLNANLSAINHKIIVARNYEPLPYKNTANDIDLLSSEAHHSQALRAIETAAETMRLVFAQQVVLPYCSKLMISSEEASLPVDVIPRFWWRGVTWLDAEAVVQSAEHHREFISRPRADHEFIITFCHSYLYGGFFPRKYTEKLAELYSLAPDMVHQHLLPVFGKSDTDFILNAFKAADFDTLDQKSTKIRLRVLLRSFLRHPLKTPTGFAYSYYQQFANRFRGK